MYSNSIKHTDVYNLIKYYYSIHICVCTMRNYFY